MREGIKTSLLSLVFAAAVSTGAGAAPTVRTIGGAGTYTSAADAATTNTTTSSRAGTLRSTGGFVRPSVSVSSAATSTDATGATGGTGSVSSGTTTIGRVASAPRLSIGKYIGAPKSISSTPSSTGNDLTARVEKLETDVAGLETSKQDVLSGSDYIIIANDEVVLDVDKLKEDLELAGGPGTDGREVEMGTNDDGLLWRYVGETEWRVLITWDAIREKLDFSGIENSLTQNITNLKNELQADLDGKLDKDQGESNAGKVLMVGTDGIVAPATMPAGGVGEEDLDAVWDHLDTLGELAYMNTVDSAHVDDKAVIRAKLADDIASVISWIEWWKENVPNDGKKYVLSVDDNGDKQWFQVITPDSDTSGGDTPQPQP